MVGFDAVGLGLVCAFGWGIGDSIGKKAVDRSSFPAVSLALQGGGLLPVLVLAALGGARLPADPGGWGLAIAMGTLGSIGFLAFYRAFAVGKLVIVAPVAGGWVAVTTLLALSVGGERPPLVPGVGALLVFVGTMLTLTGEPAPGSGRRAGSGTAATSQAPSRAIAAGGGWAVLAAVCWGIAFYLVRPMAATQGPWAPVVWSRVIGCSMILLAARFVWQRPQLIPTGPGVRTTMGLLLALIVLDTIAYAGYNYGVLAGLVSVVAPVAGASTAIAVMIGIAVLRERPSGLQAGGIVSIASGVILASF